MPKQIPSLAYVTSQLGYDNITEVRDGCYLRFDISPNTPGLPKAYLVLEEDASGCCVLQYGFGDWHGHVDESEDDAGEVDEALAVLRGIVHGELVVSASYDASSKYMGGSLGLVVNLPDHKIPRKPGSTTRIIRFGHAA